MDPDHPFDTLLGGVVECGDQLVDTIDKVGDILGHFRLIDCALHPGVSASCQYCCRALAGFPGRRGGRNFAARAEDGGGHVRHQF